MPVKDFTPSSPGKRFHKGLMFTELTKARPEKALVESIKRSGGRNNTGRVTMRYRGGGTKRAYRVIDFSRTKLNVPGTVVAIEYDPNRSANLALIQYLDGERRYILHPVGVQVGQAVLAAPNADIVPGNALPFRNIPLGTSVHNIALKIGGRGQLCRTAGSQAQLIAKEEQYALVRLPSGETRKIHADCWATVGQVGNTDHENISVGKAGRTRHRGRKPHVRGMAMNPVDHPHGGGEGRSKGGNHPSSPTGVPAKGYKTRSRKKPSQRFIVKRRKEK